MDELTQRRIAGTVSDSEFKREIERLGKLAERAA
jgi:hypothetical protein